MLKTIENMMKPRLSQVEVAQKLYGIYKTIESVSESQLNLTKAGIDDAFDISTNEKSHEFIQSIS